MVFLPLVATSKFQPTLPLRGATRLCAEGICAKRFQPTLPLRGATKVRADDVPF